MAYQIPIKYFNSFWLKKVVGDDSEKPETPSGTEPPVDSGDSTVTTYINGIGLTSSETADSLEYLIPTWPGLPWGVELTRFFYGNKEIDEDEWIDLVYPAFPFGGRNWSRYNAGKQNFVPVTPNQGSQISRQPTVEQGRERQWAIEEARITGGFNNTSVDFGAKAFAVEDDNLQRHRFSSLIYSGIFNSKSGYNNTNMFSTAEPISKSVDPANGTIQKLYAYDTNLTIFQENKVSKALIDKDAIYSAEGIGTPVTSTKVVIGQIVPYAGEYGISTNPESWAQYGFRQYFSDKFRNAILRLSKDGITEISNYGMTDFFRDELSLIRTKPTKVVLSYSFVIENPPGDFRVTFKINNQEGCDCENIEVGSLIEAYGNSLENLFVVDVQNLNNGQCLITTSIAWNPSMFINQDQWPETISFITYRNDKVIGGFDTHNKNYTLSLQSNSKIPDCKDIPDFRVHNGQPTNTYNTLNFDENINGWVSFYSYRPTLMGSLKNKFYSIDKTDIYLHYSGGDTNYGNFYGRQYDSSIEFIFNPNPSVSKNFQTVSYEGSNGWMVDYFVSDKTEQLFNLFTGQYYASNDVVNKILSYDEGRYVSPINEQVLRAGFTLKENRYVANLVNNSSPMEGEIIYGDKMSGIKGFYSTVRLKTDSTTDVGSVKELYAVSSKFVVSSY